MRFPGTEPARPRLIASNPKYRQHRASGQAIVTLDGRDFYLGAHGTTASRQEYDRLICEWLAAGRRLPRRGPGGGTAVGGSDLAVVELVAGSSKHAQVYYRHPSGHSGQPGSFRLALGHLKRLCGRTPACEFGPLR